MADTVIEKKKLVYSRPESLSEQPTHYCPGCTHGIAHRLVAEVIDELGIRDRTVGIAPVGCAVLAYNYFTFDFQEAAHGRAPAMATGIKRVRPDLIVEMGIAHGGSLICNASMLALLEYSEAVEAGTVLDPSKPQRKVLGVDIDIRQHNRAAIEAQEQRQDTGTRALMMVAPCASRLSAAASMALRTSSAPRWT